MIGSFKIKAIKTYGHTKTCITFIVENIAFTGDFIFKSTVGRTDFFDSSKNSMNESLLMFSKLPKDMIILPGHGEETTLNAELENNPYLLNLGVKYE